MQYWLYINEASKGGKIITFLLKSFAILVLRSLLGWKPERNLFCLYSQWKREKDCSQTLPAWPWCVCTKSLQGYTSMQPQNFATKKVYLYEVTKEIQLSSVAQIFLFSLLSCLLENHWEEGRMWSGWGYTCTRLTSFQMRALKDSWLR